MSSLETQTHLKNPFFALDGLYCEEERFDEDLSGHGVDESTHNFNDSLTENDLFWEDEELASLLSKEKQANLCFADLRTDASLMVARKEAIDWILKVGAHYGFSAITAILAANYFDRFVSSLCFQKGKPWMGQLVAVACLSLAAKVEETQVPLLVDLQVEESRVLFEASTIQRMELLVLSTLQWKMNPVTSLSFLDHIIRRFGLKNRPHWEFQRRCERVLLSLITDSRFVCFLPSVIATATMLLVIKEVEPNKVLDYQSQFMDILNISKEEIDDCYKLILELSNNNGKKRKYECVPASPNGVMDANFSRDNSNDSWAVASVSSSPEPLFKRSKAQDQQMRLAPINRVSIAVLCNPH